MANKKKSRTLAKNIKIRFKYLLDRFFKQSQVSHQKASAIRVETVIQNNILTDVGPSQQESDALRMKAIVLLHDQPLKSMLPHLLKAPIEMDVVDQNEKKVEVKLTQQIELHGQKLLIEGRFIRFNSKKGFSVPISDSFKISIVQQAINKKNVGP